MGNTYLTKSASSQIDVISYRKKSQLFARFVGPLVLQIVWNSVDHKRNSNQLNMYEYV